MPWKKSPQGKIPLEILKGNPGQNDYQNDPQNDYQNDPQNDPQNDGQNETPKNAIFYRKKYSIRKAIFFNNKKTLKTHIFDCLKTIEKCIDLVALKTL